MKVYVQSVVAEITRDETAEHTAAEAAFLAIARHGEQGTYEFDLAEDYREGRKTKDPDPQAQERIRVTVEWPDYKRDES